MGLPEQTFEEFDSAFASEMLLCFFRNASSIDIMVVGSSSDVVVEMHG